MDMQLTGERVCVEKDERDPQTVRRTSKTRMPDSRIWDSGDWDSGGWDAIPGRSPFRRKRPRRPDVSLTASL